MARPPKEIKFKLDHASGRYMVAFREAPERYHMTPEQDPEKALTWGRRNKNRLLAEPEKQLSIKDLAKGFFDPDGDWYKDRIAKGRRMTTSSLGIRQGHIENYIIPLLGEYDVREIIGDDIDKAIREATRYTARNGSATPTAAKPLTRSSRSKILYSVKLMFDRWMSLKIVKANPTAGIIKYSKDPERPRGALPREALAELFPPSHGAMVRVWGNSMYAALMLILYDTGTRSGEPRALRWKDYYPERAFIPIRSAIEGNTADKVKGTKAGNVKPGYLQERTVQELAIWRAESRFNSDDDFIFTVTGTTPVSNAAIGQAFKRALERLGYDATGWTPYWLRHSFVTYSLEALDESEVAMLAGHSIQVSRSQYQHPDDETLYRKSAGVRGKLAKARKEKY